MHYGDKDGYGSVYNDSGDLVLHDGERVLVTEENIIPSLKSTWRYYGGDYLLEPSKGTVYLTTERMVFINIPERMYAIGGSSDIRAMDSSNGRSFGIGNMASGGAQREYFEIPVIEIMASEKREGAVSVGQMVNVYILSSGNQLHLSMVLTDDSDLLNRLMNKKIKSLDELVNNLKEFFQRTDWLYTDLEKKMIASAAAATEPAATQRSDRQTVVDPSPAPMTYRGTEQSQRPARSKGPKLTDESIRYFRNLHDKGLITREVLDRLVREYGGQVQVPIQKARDQEPLPGPLEPAEEVPTASEVTGEGDITDEDLLDLLSGTIEGSAGPGGGPQGPSSSTVPRRAKKVIKLSVKS